MSVILRKPEVANFADISKNGVMLTTSIVKNHLEWQELQNMFYNANFIVISRSKNFKDFLWKMLMSVQLKTLVTWFFLFWI